MDEIVKERHVDRKEGGPRTEFLGFAKILWLGEPATKDRLAVCQALLRVLSHLILTVALGSKKYYHPFYR